MKKGIITSVLVMLVLTVSAQSSLRDFIDDHQGLRDVTHVTLQGGIFKLAGWLAEMSDEQDEDLEAISNLSDGIDRMEVLSFDDYDRYLDEEEIEDLIKKMKREGYEDMMTIRERNDLTRVFAMRSEKTRLYDIAIISKGHHDLSVILIDGSMDMEDISVLIDDHN